MTTIAQLREEISALAAKLSTLSANPMPPIKAAQLAAVLDAAKNTAASDAYIGNLATRAVASSTGAIDACDQAFYVSNTMADAITNGTPGALTGDGFLHQVAVANLLAAALN
jgi:hypothetical protein